MEKAVAIDPGFAMAYRSMAMSYNNLGLMSERRKYIEKALSLSDRLSDRERYQIQGDFYLGSESTFDRAIQAYNKLLELYPEDTTANHELGVLYQLIEEWNKAVEHYEICRRVKTKFTASYDQLAEVYKAKGLYDRATEVLKYYLQNIADDVLIHQALAQNYLCQGRYNLAQLEIDKAVSIEPTHFLNFYTQGLIYYYKENFPRAEKEYQKLLKEKEPRSVYTCLKGLVSLYLVQGMFNKAKAVASQGIELGQKAGIKWVESEFHTILSYLNIKSGNKNKALEESEKAWKAALEANSYNLHFQRLALFLKGYAYLEMGNIDKALLTVEQLKQLIDQGMNKKAIRYYHYLLGMIELKRQNFPRAVSYFKKALSLLPSQYSLSPIAFSNDQVLFREPIALAYLKSGELEAAQQEYEKIISLTAGRLLFGDIYAKGYYRLGRIQEQLGNKEKAIQNYQKFISLWKDADPSLPEINDARQRLAALQNL